MRYRKGGDPEGRDGGEKLGVERLESKIRIYHEEKYLYIMKEKRNKLSQFSLIS